MLSNVNQTVTHVDFSTSIMGCPISRTRAERQTDEQGVSKLYNSFRRRVVCTCICVDTPLVSSDYALQPPKNGII